MHAAAEGAHLQGDSLSATIRRHSEGLASAELGSNAVTVPAVQPAQTMVAAAGGPANPRRSMWRGPGSVVPQQLGPVEVGTASLLWTGTLLCVHEKQPLRHVYDLCSMFKTLELVPVP